MEHKNFPIFISLEQKQILLIGGGNIAARRADGMLRFGAELTVIAPEWNDAMEALREAYPDTLRIDKRVYQEGDCAGYEMVLSATDQPEVDLMVYEECKQAHIPVNIASDQSKCDFFFPALVEQDDIVLGVTSGGKNHRKVRKVSAALRDFLKAYSRNEE